MPEYRSPTPRARIREMVDHLVTEALGAMASKDCRDTCAGQIMAVLDGAVEGTVPSRPPRAGYAARARAARS